MQKVDRWVWLGPLFVVVGAALWGTETYFRIHLNEHFDSDVLVFHEHLFCIVLTLSGLLFFRFTEWRRISWQSWMYLILSGAIGSAIGTFLFTQSLRLLNPSVANVLLNFQPIVSVLFASFLLNEKWGRDFALWASVALLCGLAIALGDFQGSSADLNLGLVYVGLTALTWGFSTVAGRGAMLELPLPVATLGRFSVGALTLFLFLGAKGKLNAESLKWEVIGTVWPQFVYLSFFAGVVPLFFYFKGLQKTSASVGGFCELTQTFSALVLTWGIMGNPLSWVQVTSGLILMFAVYMINLAHAKANGGQTLVISHHGEL